MTLLSSVRSVTYAGDGKTKVFAIPFPFQQPSDVAATVTLADGTMTTPGFLPAGAGTATGGTATFAAAPAAGSRVLLYRDPPITQDASFVDHTKFPAASVEGALDRGRMVEGRTRDLAAASVRAMPSEPPLDMTLPSLFRRVGKLLGFGDSGTPVPVDVGFAVQATPAVEYLSRFAVGQSIVPAPVIYLRTGGYYTAGDGGGALYKRVAAQPAHGLCVQSADGAWWSIAEARINALQAGAVNDGTADCSDAFDRAWTFAKRLDVPPGTYSLSRPLLVPSLCEMAGAGRDRTFFQRWPGSTPTLTIGTKAYACLVGTALPLSLTAPTQRVRMSGFTVTGDATLDRGMVLCGVQLSFFSDILVSGCTRAPTTAGDPTSGAWGVELISKGFAATSTTTCVYANKNRFDEVFTDTCYNGLRVFKGPDDPTAYSNTAGNITRLFGGGDKDYQGTGCGMLSAQGASIFGRFNQTIYDNTIAFEIAGEYTVLAGCTADTNLAMNSAPGAGTIPGTSNIYGFQNGRVNSAKGVLFAAYRDGRGAAATGSVMVAQQGNGCYDRITFTDMATYGTVAVINNTAGYTMVNPRAINALYVENLPTQRMRVSPGQAGVEFVIDEKVGYTGAVAAKWSAGMANGNDPTTGAPLFTSLEGARLSYSRTTGVFDWLVGKTNYDITTAGCVLRSTGLVSATAAGPQVFLNNIATADGPSVQFNRSGNPVGNISVTANATAYNTSSDYRLKQNPVALGTAMDLDALLAALKPYRFTWKADGSTGYGFLAHELQTVIPEAVTGAKDAVAQVPVLAADGTPQKNADGSAKVQTTPVYQGVDQGKLTPYLVAIAQAQAATIAKLTARVAALEAKAGTAPAS